MSKKIVFLLAVGAAALATLPNLYGLLKTPPGALYLWSSLPWDSNTYLILMRVGYDGAWLQTNLLTSERHPPVLSLPFYIALGHVAKAYGRAWGWIAGESIPAWRVIPMVYQHSRTVLTVALVFAVYGLASLITTRRCRRLWIVAYAMFAGGLTWAENTAFTESNVLASCISFPHFIAALIFYIASCAAMILGLQDDDRASWAPCRARRGWALALSVVGGLGLGWVHPFDLPPLFAIGAVMLVARRVQTGKFPRVALAVYLAFCAVSGLSVLYQMSIAWRLPDFREIDKANVLHWWHRWASLEALDGPFFLSIPAMAFLIRRRRRPEALFIPVWIVVVVVMMHIPFRFQRRMIEGLAIAFACALPWTVEGFLIRPLRWRKAKPRNVRARIRLVRHVAYAFVLLAFLPRTFYVLYDRSIVAFGHPSDLNFVHPGEVQAADWLARNARPGSVVWASKWCGNRLPFLSGMRVFFGHNVMTVRWQEKERMTNSLFSLALPVADFRAAVKEYGIDYVLWTARDRLYAEPRLDIGLYDPATLGKPVFDNGFARVFAVNSRQ